MTTPFSYDVIEYPTYIHPQMHPTLLAAIARLHGLRAASPDDCRVLEVGCGNGLQLLALAQAHPHSRFVGIDLSHAAIAAGEALRQQAGIHNVQFHCADLLTWDPGNDSYDYILAHGFYSWVPGAVQARLLALCASHLAAEGVAYVSYNALPGNQMRQMLRSLMTFRLDRDAPPDAQIAHAAGVLGWFQHNIGRPEDGAKEGYISAMTYELDKSLKDLPPALFFHDDLAPCNQSFFFCDFMAQAGVHGLDFLAEADYFEMSDMFLGVDARKHLDVMSGGDRIVRDQYLDFLKGRRFRQTLLVRAGTAHTPDLAAITHLQVDARIQGEVTNDGSGLRFFNETGAALVVKHAGIAAAFSALTHCAHPVPFQLLLEHALANTPADQTEELPIELARTLRFGLEIGLLSLVCDPPRFAHSAGATPSISPLTRAQLEAGDHLLASLRPAIVRIDDPLARELLRLLDGTRNRETLLSDLRLWDAQQPEQTRQPPSALTAAALEDALTGLAKRGLLMEDNRA